MSGSEEAIAEAFERHVPEHPLPEELKKMKRDDTVCKFCGVSYLIHNEMKAMEDKLKATLAEMEHFRGSVEREKKLIEDMAYKDREMQKLRDELTAKDQGILSLQNDLRVKDDTCSRLQATRAELQEKLGASIQEAESLRLKHNFLLEGVRSFKTDLGHQKASMRELRSKVIQQGNDLNIATTHLTATVTRVCSNESNTIRTLQDKVSELQTAKQKAHQDISALQDKLGASVAESAMLKNSRDNENRLKLEVQKLKDSVHELEAENISLSNRLRTVNMELEQIQEQIRNKTSEIEKLSRQLQTQEKSSESITQRLQKDLEQKTEDVFRLQQELRRSSDQCQKMERLTADLKLKNSSSHNMTAELEEDLRRARSDCEALKSEREMIIEAHQSQIEQLRQSFKSKLNDADHFPKKLEEALRNEKKKHVMELETLEQKLKENFVMELQIEKQKHQELLEKYLFEYKDSDKKMKSELNAIQSRHKAEIAEVHRQMAEAKSRSREAENTLRKEIESLKKIIKDLEARLAKVDFNSDAVSSEWRTKASLLERDLDEIKQDKMRLESQVEKLREERAFLEETVRRECEERFELTEALSDAKEELLRMKRPPGGYSNSNTPRAGNSPHHNSGADKTRIPSSRNSSSKNSEEMMLFRKRRNSIPHPPQKPKDSEVVDTNNVSIGFQGETQASQSGVGKKLKGGTVGESRRRIAEAIGRT